MLGRLTSENYRLVSVHIVSRHGDRFILHKFPNYSQPQISCEIGEKLKEQVPLMQGYETSMKKQMRLPQQTFHDLDPYPNEETCNPGHLTPTGAAQLVLLGDSLRQVYINKWNLIEKLHYSEQVLIRATTRARTYKTALALLYGLLPDFQLHEIQIEASPTNAMLVNVASQQAQCQGISKHADSFAATFNQNSPAIREDEKSIRLYNHMKKVFGEGVSAMRVGDMFDVGIVHHCHGLSSPQPIIPVNPHAPCMPKWALRDTIEILQENAAVRVASPDYQRVAILRLYPLLSEIVSRMEQQANSSSQLRYVHYSGHDSTVDPLLTVLKCTDGTWPGYASRVVFELYANHQASQRTAGEPVGFDQFYVRLLFNGKTVTKHLLCCQVSGRNVDDELCPLDVFAKCIREDLLSQIGEETFKEACDKNVY